MRPILPLLALVTVLVSANMARGQEPVSIPADSLVQIPGELLPRIFWFREGWRLHPGEVADGAAPGLNDRAWLPVDPKHPDQHPGWAGLGWYRLHLDVDAALVGKDLVLSVGQMGASEFYLDGRRVAGFGVVSDTLEREVVFGAREWMRGIPIRFRSPGRHTLAVHYSNHHYIKYPFLAVGMIDEPGIVVGIGRRAPIDRKLTELARSISARQMLAGLPLALAFLHAMLWLFRREIGEHRDQGLFALSTAGMLYFPFGAGFHSGIWLGFLHITLFKISLICSAWFGMRLIYTLFGGVRRQTIRWTGHLLVALIGLSWAAPVEVFYVATLLGFFEMIRVVTRAMCRRERGAGIVGLGCIVLTLSCFAQILIQVEIVTVQFMFPYVYGILALVVSLSIHLARQYARTQLELENHLEQVQKLIVVTLAQERESVRAEASLRLGESERRLLEAENELRTRELEEARRRQQDLEKLETANRKLRDTRARLVQSERMAAIGNLVAGIAHEINTPVGAIRSSHDTLMRAVARLEKAISEHDEAAPLLEDSRSLRVIREANRIIQTGTDRVADIIRSLRNFARLDEAAQKRVDIREGIDSTLTLVHHHLKGRIEVVKQYDDIPPVLCYPGRLNQVFLNLLVNAAQAIEDSGTITIATSEAGGRVEVRIIDTGIGIAPEHIGHIFDSGYTTKKAGEGTGLGLSISRQIIEDHKGTITVESTVGEGTRFIVSLPIG